MNADKKQSTHILVLRLSAMGDVAMTVPVLKLLLEQYPNVSITVVSRPLFAPFFSKLPRCHFFAADVDKHYRGIMGLWRLASDLLALRPNKIADLHEVLRTNLLDLVLKLRSGHPLQKIDKGRKEKKALCAHKKHKKIYPLRSTHARYADVFARLGFPIDLNKENSIINFTPTKFSEENLIKIKDKTPIGIAPFARYVGKTYPADLMRKVIKLLLQKRPDLHIFLFGGKSDAEILNVWQKDSPENITVIAGIGSLEEEMSLMSSLKLVLSMDSANMHIAAMLGIPVVSLWGATHPFLGFYGWQQDPKNAILPDMEKFPTLPCSVNGKKVHPEAIDCMRSIAPERVAEVILSIEY